MIFFLFSFCQPLALSHHSLRLGAIVHLFPSLSQSLFPGVKKYHSTEAALSLAMYELRGPPAPPSFGAGPSGYGASGGGGGAPGGGPAFRGAGGDSSSSFTRDRTGGGGGAADAVGKVKDPILRVISWAKSRNPREKAILGGAAALLVSFFFERGWDRFDSVRRPSHFLSLAAPSVFSPLLLLRFPLL